MPDGRRLQPSCFQRPRRALNIAVPPACGKGGCGRRRAGFVPALVHPGNVWLAEAMTGHLAMRGMTGRAGQRLVLRKTMTGGRVRFRGQAR